MESALAFANMLEPTWGCLVLLKASYWWFIFCLIWYLELQIFVMVMRYCRIQSLRQCGKRNQQTFIISQTAPTNSTTCKSENFNLFVHSPELANLHEFMKTLVPIWPTTPAQSSQINKIIDKSLLSPPSFWLHWIWPPPFYAFLRCFCSSCLQVDHQITKG